MIDFVMPGLVPGIHAFMFGQQERRARKTCKKDLDDRDKPGHDDTREFS
jgi:hypothetical protein